MVRYMKFRHLILTTGCLLLLCGCKDSKPDFGAPMTIRVMGVNGRADLPQGLKVGLFVGSPVGADNVPLSAGDMGYATPDADVKWRFDQTASARFFAYSPYDASFGGQESAIIHIPADQSSADSIEAANVLTATTQASPKDQSVVMHLEHAMTAMTVSFDNRTGQDIASLTVNGFMTEGQLDLLSGNFKATGSIRPITPMRADDGSESFCFYYPPQNATPTFTVTFESGQSIPITYESYCHEYGGKIIRMNKIVLTPTMLSDPNRNIQILPLKGVNISQWAVTGKPAFDVVPATITLSQLNTIEPDVNDSNFFSAYLKKVTVTAVDRTNPDWPGLVLEDSTRAIHVWAYYRNGLQEGNTIVGPVLGRMDKALDGQIYINNFYTEYATIGTDTLPLTETTLRNIMSRRSYFEYRRVLLHNVTLKSRFQNGMGVFVQGSTDFDVVCDAGDINMVEGSRGDLTGFPVWSGSSFYIKVYDTRQFDGFKVEPIANVLTSRSDYGLYTITTIPDTAIYRFAGREESLQMASHKYSNACSLQVTDPVSGETHYVYLYDCPDGPMLGHSYTVAFNVSGKTAARGNTVTMDCIRTDDGKAWLMDRDASNGLIVPL